MTRPRVLRWNSRDEDLARWAFEVIDDFGYDEGPGHLENMDYFRLMIQQEEEENQAPMEAALQGNFRLLADMVKVKRDRDSLSDEAWDLISLRLRNEYKATKGRAYRTTKELLAQNPLRVIATWVPLVEKILRWKFPEQRTGYKKRAKELVASHYDISYDRLNDYLNRPRSRRR